MKKGVLVLSILLLVVGAASALPSYFGLRGLNRTVDAKPIGAGEFSMALFTFLGMSDDTRWANLDGSSFEVTDTESDGLAYLTLGLGLGDKVEMAGRISYVWNSLKRDDVDERVTDAGESESDNGISEATFSMKFSSNPGGGDFWWGVMPWASFGVYDGGDNPWVTNYGAYDGIWYPEQPMFEMRRPMIGTDLGVGGDLLLSLQMSPTFLLHTNIGYHFFRQSFQFTDHRYGTDDSVAVDMTVEDPVFHLAVGLELPLKGVTLFTEAEWRHFMKRDYEQGDGEDYDDIITVTPGIRFPTKSGFAFDIVGTIAMDNFDPEWSDLGHSLYQSGENPTDGHRADFAPFPGGYPASWGIGLNLMYSSDLREGPGTGVLSGTVTDAVTGEPLAATVAFPGIAVQSALSDAGTGFYSAELPEGSVTVSVNSSGYIGAGETFAVEGGVDLTRDYALQPEPSRIIGRVTDMQTGTPIRGATVDAIHLSDVTGADGLYELVVGDGAYTITATAAGYLGEVRETSVAGETVELNFQLQSVSFEPVYFDVDLFNIKPEFNTLLNGIAEAITANGLTVQICGHADSDASDEYNMTLSDNRAMSVYDYLVAHGVSASSLSTIGYGESRPAVPNTSEANKALNRRVEFVVQ
jgi:outer membrane protein OmpA-like peptidoglycan-associated protein